MRRNACFMYESIFLAFAKKNKIKKIIFFKTQTQLISTEVISNSRGDIQ